MVLASMCKLTVQVRNCHSSFCCVYAIKTMYCSCWQPRTSEPSGIAIACLPVPPLGPSSLPQPDAAGASKGLRTGKALLCTCGLTLTCYSGRFICVACEHPCPTLCLFNLPCRLRRKQTGLGGQRASAPRECNGNIMYCNGTRL